MVAARRRCPPATAAVPANRVPKTQVGSRLMPRPLGWRKLGFCSAKLQGHCPTCLVGPRLGVRSAMRLGVLVVGSNSAQLQVVDAIAGAEPLPCARSSAPPASANKSVPTDRFRRRAALGVVFGVSLAVIAARQFELQRMYACVTAAIGDARNRDTILERVQNRMGVRLQFLSGEQAARLTYAAVRRWYRWQAGRVLNIDIGGGSNGIGVRSRSAAGLCRVTALGCRTHDPRVPGLGADPVGQADESAGQAHYDASWMTLPNASPGRVSRVVWWRRRRRSSNWRGCAQRPSCARVHSSGASWRPPTWSPACPARDAPDAAGRTRAIAGACQHRGPDRSSPQPSLRCRPRGCLDIDEVELSPWALRRGIIFEHLAALTDTTAVPLQPVDPSAAAAPTATVTTLPTRR
jgi:exopolyphosphatase / guanosine-5'-triphosphate,3'-diphosphate pyrophosphatase